jgi:hypothetical protein
MKRTTFARKMLASGSAAIGLLIGAAAPAFAGGGYLQDAGFESPVVSGAVSFATGAQLGPCANGSPYTGADYKCWLDYAGQVDLVHNDYAMGGVKVVPNEGQQFLWLAGQRTISATGASAYYPGAVSQAVTVPAGSTRTLSFVYATMPVPGASSVLHLRVKSCTANGLNCTIRVDQYLSSTSTGNPASIGWKAVRYSIPVNTDQSLVQVQFESALAASPTAPATTGDPVVDNTTLL